MSSSPRSVTLGALAVLVPLGCAQRSDVALGPRDRPTTTSSTTSTRPPAPTMTTSAAPTPTATAPTTATTESPTTELALIPGEPCELGSHPDCIDPDGDGAGTYLVGGGDCMAQFADAPELCSDLDLDGVAGYPDSG